MEVENKKSTKRRGAQKPNSYSASFKYRVVCFAESNQHLTDSEVALFFQIPRTLVTKWKKMRTSIEDASADALKQIQKNSSGLQNTLTFTNNYLSNSKKPEKEVAGCPFLGSC